MTKKLNICVFSSSSNAIPEIYFEEAEKLGRLIGEGNHNLINGGANVGQWKPLPSPLAMQVQKQLV